MSTPRPVLKGVKMFATGNSVVLSVNDEVAFEYVHPDPAEIMAMIHVTGIRPGPWGDGRMEVKIDWGHGCGWCDGGHQKTKLVAKGMQA